MPPQGRSQLVAEPRRPPALLPGDASTPFYTRCNHLWAAQSRQAWRQPWLSMAFSIIILYRCWHLLTPGSAAWLLTSLAIAVADIVWRSRAWHSYVRWRELPAAALCLNAFGPTAAWVLMRRLLDDHGAPVGASWAAQMAAHVAHLLFASGAAKMAANALSLRVRLSLSVVVQLALLLATAPHTASICASAPPAHPAAQRLTAQLYRCFNTLTAMVAVPVSGTAATLPNPELQCITLILWLRLGLSLLAPLLYAAMSEARLWQLHQQQLPRERRTAASPLVRAARWLSWEDSWLHVGLLCWLLLAVSWDWCAVFLAPRAAAYASA